MMSIAEIVISITLIAVVIHLFAFSRFMSRKLDKLEKLVELQKL